jgi:glycosyltransferase involved in cell wall biosynthesis
MRIVVDALCAEYGGIRTYVEQTLAQWHELYPDDDVHVVLRAGSTLATPGLTRHEFAVGRPDMVQRPRVQMTAMHGLIKELKPDAILATAPTTDIRRSASPLAIVILDLRFEILPHEFTPARRMMRRVSYGRSYQLAAGFLAISHRSLDDLHRLHPSTTSKPSALSYLGADHVAAWPEPSRSGPAIAFAHHTNKNPELLVEAWAKLRADGYDRPLLFLGVNRELRDTLTELIAARNLTDTVQLSPFLEDDEFQKTLASAGLIAFPSSFEGFGLPIVEGMALGKPVVIGPDTGCIEIAGGHAALAKDWTADAVAEAVLEAEAMGSEQLQAARTHAATFTWQQTVEQTRELLQRISKG